jgi:hypothetical protein
MSTNSSDPGYHPWHPMTDARDVKTLGKLGEETGELSAAICRCLIQGVDECEPVTGKSNRQWLEDEIADVRLHIRLVIERFALDEKRMAEREAKKEGGVRWWHEQA